MPSAPEHDLDTAAAQAHRMRHAIALLALTRPLFCMLLLHRKRPALSVRCRGVALHGMRTGRHACRACHSAGTYAMQCRTQPQPVFTGTCAPRCSTPVTVHAAPAATPRRAAPPPLAHAEPPPLCALQAPPRAVAMRCPRLASAQRTHRCSQAQTLNTTLSMCREQSAAMHTAETYYMPFNRSQTFSIVCAL